MSSSISLQIEPYQRLLHLETYENHLQVDDSLPRKPCFLKVIPSVLGRSVNFNIMDECHIGFRTQCVIKTLAGGKLLLMTF